MTQRILGIRAEPKGFHWAVLEGTRESPVLHAKGKALAPAAYAEPAALSSLRDRVLHLIETYRPSAVGVRFAESIGRGGNTEPARRRCRVEGVILETAHFRGLPVLTGALATIGSRLGIKTPKKCLAGADFRGLSLSDLADECREAVFVAAAQLPPSTTE